MYVCVCMCVCVCYIYVWVGECVGVHERVYVSICMYAWLNEIATAACGITPRPHAYTEDYTHTHAHTGNILHLQNTHETR